MLASDGRTVSSDQMDAFILMVELHVAYGEILSIEHTERLECQRRYTMIIMMALDVLREAKDTVGRVRVRYASRPRVEQLGGRYFLYLETISFMYLVRGKPFYHR